ncbi:unnamed protein product, partial [Mesorhabditis belari]|uniref:Vacuolar protein sorting-associated protein 54 n=1 Tax=Mesorhabditis belari TaxID=2138241 RepID=A0AAF3FRS3_9BILA
MCFCSHLLSSSITSHPSCRITNNLASVVADPLRPRAELQAFFTRHWGETFVPIQEVPKCPHLQPVNIANLSNYMKSIGQKYALYVDARRKLSKVNKQYRKNDTDDLPTVFLSSDFSLTTPETFLSVFTVPAQSTADPLAITVRTPKPDHEIRDKTCLEKASGDFRHYEPLQTRLDDLHDVVDSRLAEKLVLKKDAFWQIVSSYGGLNEELADALGQIKVVRTNLKRVSTSICERTDHITALYKKRQHKEKLLARLHDIACVRAAQSTVQLLLNQNEYPRALECIEMATQVLKNELSGVTAFRHLESQLSELRNIIKRMMWDEFTSYVQKEFGARIDEPVGIVHEGELCSIIAGLLRLKCYAFTSVLKNEVEETVKNLLRQTVKQRVVISVEDQIDPLMQNLSNAVRSLKFPDWCLVLDDVINALYLFNQKIECLQEMVGDLCERVERDNVPDANDEGSPERNTPVNNIAMASSSSDADDFASINVSLLTSASAPMVDAVSMLSIEVRSTTQLKHAVSALSQYTCHCIQMRICRLLNARHKDEAQNALETTPTELSHTLNCINVFQQKCSTRGWCRAPQVVAIAGKLTAQPTTNGPLQICIHKISTDYIDRFHRQRRQRISDNLDLEQWRVGEVTHRDQRLINQSFDEGKLVIVEKETDDEKGQATPQQLTVKEENFEVVRSALNFVYLLAEYAECLRALPSFAPDIIMRIIELLKFFNSRSCQLILGAGALQLVGLKTISVRNLALSSRSLQLIMNLVPLLRDEVDSLLTDEQKHLLRHFSQVSSDYNDHVNEITAKLVSVIDHNIVGSLDAWKPKGTIPSESFQAICRNLVKFHNGMNGIMPDSQIATLFTQVHAHFRNHLKLKVAQCGVSPHDSLAWGVVSNDYSYYIERVHAMPACRNMQFESLNEIVFN